MHRAPGSVADELASGLVMIKAISRSPATAPSPSQHRPVGASEGNDTFSQVIVTKLSVTAVTTCTAKSTTASRETFLWSPPVTNRGQCLLDHRFTPMMPRTTLPVSSNKLTRPVALVRYHRACELVAASITSPARQASPRCR